MVDILGSVLGRGTGVSWGVLTGAPAGTETAPLPALPVTARVEPGTGDVADLVVTDDCGGMGIGTGVSDWGIPDDAATGGAE